MAQKDNGKQVAKGTTNQIENGALSALPPFE
jgi:hypothetical protein